MFKVFSSIKNDRQLLPQIVFVFAAFFVMVLIGSVFGGRIIDRNVESYGKAAVSTAGETISAYLDEYNLILGDVSFSLIQLDEQGAGPDDLHASIIAWTDRLRESNVRYDEFSGFYGVLHGQFVDGTNWDPTNPESEDYNPDYKPHERPWFIGAVDADGGIHITDPYVDADTGEYVLTLSQMLVGNDGHYIGIVGMDLFLTDVEEIVRSLTLLESGYGILLDSTRKVVVTYHEDLMGTHFDDIDEGHAAIGASLDAGEEVAHHNILFNGEPYVVFFDQISSGWYVGVASPRENYYNDRNLMTLTLSLVGLLMALPLSAVLVYLHIKKARADEASQLKTSFLANMSHEIRTPMNAIIGMTELLQNEHLNEQQEGFVKDINTSAQALLSIINDILDLSKIEAGKIELRPVDYDFPVFLDNIVSMFRFVTSDKGLDFRYEKTGNLPECLYGDDLRLRQVLTNLCGNAIKFTNEGYVCLYVDIFDNEISIVIKDTGLGIRKEDLPKLFNPFEQFDMQSNRKIIGTGLGLSISKNFIEMMGGTIKVESEYGKGTMFLVKIPIVHGDPSKIGQSRTPEELKPFVAPDAKVLIVDDNEVNLKVASGLLNKLYKIDAQTTLSGKDAIALVQENDYDMVFMDHMMPEMDGVQTVAEIRKLGGKFKDLKIIALTANAITGIREMFITNGFDGFISKPIDTVDLYDVLREVLPSEKIITIEEASGVAVSLGNGSPAFRNALDNARLATMLAASDGDSTETERPSDFISTLSRIDAINPQIALSRVSGLEDMLADTLKLFYSKLAYECDRLEQFSNAGDMNNFSIAVHGLKSALSSVGAMDLSEKAFELEKASKQNDSAYCSEHLPEFLSELRSLYDSLTAAFPEFTDSSSNDGTVTPGDPALLKEKVQEILAACEDFDDTAALEALDSLAGFDFGSDINTALKTAKTAIGDFDYDSAISALSSIGK